MVAVLTELPFCCAGQCRHYQDDLNSPAVALEELGRLSPTSPAWGWSSADSMLNNMCGFLSDWGRDSASSTKTFQHERKRRRCLWCRTAFDDAFAPVALTRRRVSKIRTSDLTGNGFAALTAASSFASHASDAKEALACPGALSSRLLHDVTSTQKTANAKCSQQSSRATAL